MRGSTLAHSGNRKSMPRSSLASGGGGHIQLCDGNFAGALFGEDPEGFAHNGVILDFLGVSIAEDQHSLGVDLRFERRWRWVRRRLRLPFVPQARHFLIQTINFILLNLAVLIVRV